MVLSALQNLLVIEDNPRYQKIIKDLIGPPLSPNLKVVSSLDEALGEIEGHRPDGVITDLHFCQNDEKVGWELGREVVQRFSTEFPKEPPLGLIVAEKCLSLGIPYQMVLGHHGEQFPERYPDGLIGYALETGLIKEPKKNPRFKGDTQRYYSVDECFGQDYIQSQFNFGWIAKSSWDQWASQIARLLSEVFRQKGITVSDGLRAALLFIYSNFCINKFSSGDLMTTVFEVKGGLQGEQEYWRRIVWNFQGMLFGFPVSDI